MEEKKIYTVPRLFSRPEIEYLKYHRVDPKLYRKLKVREFLPTLNKRRREINKILGGAKGNPEWQDGFRKEAYGKLQRDLDWRKRNFMSDYIMTEKKLQAGTLYRD